VVSDLAEFLAPELEQSHITTELELTTGDDTAQLDERFLKQALLNLVKNSMQAMPQGGKLVLSTKRLTDRLQFRLTDTGSGIPEELMQKIFEPYFTTKDFGSGLGLTLVYKIVKEHGAEIQVTSKSEHGTSITILFPYPHKAPALLSFQGGAP
jgi:signal transduction histidine kinase